MPLFFGWIYLDYILKKRDIFPFQINISLYLYLFIALSFRM